jgi:hypothetical protein
MSEQRGDDEVGRREYLGDGVYVAFDGFGLWLTTENGPETTNRVYLEPEVLAALERFVARLREPKL